MQLPPCLSSPEPLPSRIQFIFHTLPFPSILPKTVCIVALNQLLAVNLKWHGYENISLERWALAEEMSTMRSRATAVLGALTFYLTTSSPPISLLCQDVSDWLSVRAQWLAVIRCYLYPSLASRVPALMNLHLFWQDRSLWVCEPSSGDVRKKEGVITVSLSPCHT